MPEHAHDPKLRLYEGSAEIFELDCICGNLTTTTGSQQLLRRAWDTHLALMGARRSESGKLDFDVARGRLPKLPSAARAKPPGKPSGKKWSPAAVPLDETRAAHAQHAHEAVRLAVRAGARHGKVRLTHAKHTVVSVSLQAAAASVDGDMFGPSDAPRRSLAAHIDIHLRTLKRNISAMQSVLWNEPEARRRCRFALGLLEEWKIPMDLPATWLHALAIKDEPSGG